jgi:dTDP-4-dehydrorhamnose reductase
MTIDLDRRLERALVLGGSGLLGAALVPALEQAGIAVDAPPHTALDLLDLDGIRRRLRERPADLVVNLAAQSKVDQAERQPEQAFALNAAGAHNAALAAAEAGIAILQLSTDYVLAGTRRSPYREYHETGTPPNLYGCSKLEGEQLVRATTPLHFIVRVAALYGDGGRPDFLDWVLASADPRAPLRIVADRFVSPTWIVELSRQLLTLVRTRYFGTYHAAGAGAASWYELARSALVLAGKDPEGVVPIPDHELESVARRGAYTCLENHRLHVRGLELMRPWREALAEHLRASSAPPVTDPRGRG